MSIFSLLCLFLFITISILPNYAQNVTTTSVPITSRPLTTFMTSPALTVPAFVVGYLESASNNQLNLTSSYCEWNVTLIVKLINETDATFLYSDTNKALLPQHLPEYIKRQLPPSLLRFYGLNYTTPISQECGGSDSGAVGTIPPLQIDFCVGPLIHTDLINPVNKDAESRRISLKNVTGLDMFINVSLAQCGLACTAGGEVYGLTENEQDLVDLFKILGSTLCFVAIIFLVVNQYVDQKRGGTKFTDKPLLQIIPYLITISLFLIVALMTVGEVIGKESIVCSNHEYGDYDEEKLEFSSWNPIQGKSAACTIHGILFYSSLLMYEFYTVLLSFVIFRQLYAPMRPLWNITQRWWHFGISILIIILDIISLIMSSHGGVWPMGVCLPGPSVKNELFVFVNMPFILSCTASFILLLASAVLLKKEVTKQKQIVNKDSTNRIQDLLTRLIFYFIGVLMCLILLNITALQFYIKSDALSHGMDKSIQCQLEQILLDPTVICNDKDRERMSPFFFISWIIAAILGVGSQIVLSCHNEARSRLKRVTTLKDTAIGSKLKNIRDKTKSKSGSNQKLPSSPNSPKSSSKTGTSPFSNGVHPGTITITPRGKTAPIERLNSDDEDDPIGDIQDIELTAQNRYVASTTIPINSYDETTTTFTSDTK